MSAGVKTELPDQAQRAAFCGDTSRPFSIIAPAGVGKTYAITQRIVSLARRGDAAEILPRLLVVTYTRRAAQEMQARARAHVLAARLKPEVEAAFGQAFFGTIHSLCVRLLQNYGHALGLPPAPQLLTDEDQEWAAFWRSDAADTVLRREAAYGELLRICPLVDVQSLARKLRPFEMPPTQGGLPLRPKVIAAPVLDYPAAGRSKNTIGLAQQQLRQFVEALEAGDRFAAWPANRCSAKDFVPVWEAALAPLQDWVREVLTHLAGELAAAAQDFRRERGVLSYDDQIAFAAALLRQPEVQEEIDERQHLVILDEAQDTDPLQFDVLSRLAGWPSANGSAPDPARFVMVGDPQQSIYPQRADLATYQQQHEVFAGQDGQSAFQVTFRCDAQIVDWVNEVMPSLLDGQVGQTDYVQLKPRPESSGGQVLRLPIRQEGDLPASMSGLADLAARKTAAFLIEAGLEGLRARSWGEVALLCPRRKQLACMERALREAGLECQVHSTRDILGDHPAYAWVCATVWCLSHPRDGFEIIGLLREVFGCTDHDLAMYGGGEGDSWRIDCQPEQRGYAVVEAALRSLHEAWRHGQAAAIGLVLELLEERLGLRSRLAALAPLAGLEVAEMEAEWTRLTLDALALERQGATISRWADELKRGFSSAREFEHTSSQAVQLLTCLKAKGLEWDAVVLPLFFQPMVAAPDNYPQVHQPPGKSVPEVFFSKEDKPEGHVRPMESEPHYERMLYVAMTRARHTLVLADDEALFATLKRNQKNPSLGKMLLQGDTNRPTWEALPTETVPEFRLEGESEESTKNGPAGITEADGSGLITLAREHAGAFARRVTPHALAKQPSPEEPEARAEMSLDEDRPELPAQTPATLYGTWWHELMEAIPWQGAEADLNQVYQEALRASPDAVRSAKEWDLLQKSDLWQALRQPGLLCRAEVPFLWKQDARLVVEGVADLAVWQDGDQSWQIIDWKTNRLPSSPEKGLAILRDEYAPQIEAYLEAWRAMFPAARNVRGLLYSTQLGQGVTIG